MIFDGHTDIWADVTRRRLNAAAKNVLQTRHLSRLAHGGIQGGIFVVWPDPPHDLRPYQRTLEIFENVKLELEANREHIQLLKRYEDIAAGIQGGKLLVMIGFEGLSSIGDDLELLEFYYQFGGRCASLTWNEENLLATGCNGAEDRGLTAIGRRAVRKLEQLGMILDLSHANDRTFWDLARVVEKPVIASHSNCRSICANQRNLTDEQLKFIGSTGGLVGVNALGKFIHAEPQRRSLQTLVDHVEHIAGQIGIEHVACGFDFCDFLTGEFHAKGARGLEDASKAPMFIDELTARGFKKKDIDRIAFQNFFDLFKQIL